MLAVIDAVVLPDPVIVPPALADVVAAEVVVASTTLLTVLVGELLVRVLPVSCTASARAVNPVVPTCCESAGAVVGARALL